MSLPAPQIHAVRTAASDEPSLPEFEVGPPFSLSGAVGLLGLAAVSALIWAGLVWAIVEVVA
ncbi:MAG: hypothetical protein QOE65_522 [Solirubrobacteraceae bacterium]|jgi:hypothetical protein|nr:hypothetical protein [Solirubrobacteraceae bacterium]